MQQEQDVSLFSLNLDQTGRGHLSEAARWAKFLSIVGFIICGFIIVMGLFFGSLMSMFSSRYDNNPYGDLSVQGSGLGTAMLVYYLIVGILYFIPNLFLFRFATKMKTALAANDQDVVNLSFQNLKACFRFVGILTIIFLAISILGFIVMILGFAMGSGM
jgi:hypothetical protein